MDEEPAVAQTESGLTVTHPSSLQPNPSPTALLIQAHFASSQPHPSSPPPPPTPWKPTPCFFYGTLTDPELLQTLLALTTPPLPRAGTISGFTVKMWGMYPALVRAAAEKDERAQVPGMLYEVQAESQFRKLQRYETSAYTWCTCDVVLDDGERVEGVRTFCWAGDSRSRELKEGAFDRGRWRAYFRGSVLGKGDAG